MQSSPVRLSAAKRLPRWRRFFKIICKKGFSKSVKPRKLIHPDPVTGKYPDVRQHAFFTTFA